MRRDREYLPQTKRHELELVTRIFLAEFQGSLVGGTAPHRQAGRSLKLVLLGYDKGGVTRSPIRRLTIIAHPATVYETPLPRTQRSISIPGSSPRSQRGSITGRARAFCGSS